MPSYATLKFMIKYAIKYNTKIIGIDINIFFFFFQKYNKTEISKNKIKLP